MRVVIGSNSAKVRMSPVQCYLQIGGGGASIVVSVIVLACAHKDLAC
jgi:hypothetical protein